MLTALSAKLISLIKVRSNTYISRRSTTEGECCGNVILRQSGLII